VTEAAQTTAAGAAQRPEQTQTTAAETAQTPEQTQTPEAAGTQEVSRKVSLELRRFPTQQIPQELPYRWSDEDLTHYLPEDRYLPEDLAYQYHQEGRCQQGLSAR
jgi:hypothetical protein